MRKHDEHEFGDDARHYHAHGGTEQAGDEKESCRRRIIRHGRERTDQAGEKPMRMEITTAEPIKHFDHGGRHETAPTGTDSPRPNMIPLIKFRADSRIHPQTALRDCRVNRGQIEHEWVDVSLCFFSGFEREQTASQRTGARTAGPKLARHTKLAHNWLGGRPRSCRKLPVGELVVGVSMASRH